MAPPSSLQSLGNVNVPNSAKTFTAHLYIQGVLDADWGSDAVKGWNQVFSYNFGRNVIEVHKVLNVAM